MYFMYLMYSHVLMYSCTFNVLMSSVLAMVTGYGSPRASALRDGLRGDGLQLPECVRPVSELVHFEVNVAYFIKSRKIPGLIISIYLSSTSRLKF